MILKEKPGKPQITYLTGLWKTEVKTKIKVDNKVSQFHRELKKLEIVEDTADLHPGRNYLIIRVERNDPKYVGMINLVAVIWNIFYLL